MNVSQSYRNGNIIRVPGRVGYVVAPSTSVFVEVAPNWRNFQVDSFDSHGYRVVGGMLFDFKNVPLDAFVEIAGVFEYDFKTGVGAGLNLGAGVRYYF